MEGGITGKGYTPGISGNPGGRPKTGLPAKLRAKDGLEVYNRLVKIAKGEVKASLRVQVQAAKIVLAYCWGLPVQRMQIDSGAGFILEIVQHRTIDCLTTPELPSPPAPRELTDSVYESYEGIEGH